MSFWKWSTVAASNATADSTCPFPEGMAASALNDGTRGMMAALAKYRDDCGPNIQTAGSSTAYTLATNQVFTSLATLANKEFSCFMHGTNGPNPTLSIDGLAAKPIVTDASTAVPEGTLISGSVYSFVYSDTAGKFFLKNFMGNPYNLPLGGLMDYICPAVPNSSFIFPIGQAISRTTYAALFALIGTTYGAGDGSTTFNVPDLTGRTSYMKEAVATRLTSATVGIDGGTLGAVGGGTQTLTTANLPAYTPAGTITNGAISTSSDKLGITAGGSGAATGAGGTPATQTITSTQGASTFAGTPQGGASTPIKMAASGIVLNKILRII